MRQGRVLGRNLIRHHAGESLRSFDFKGFGELASIGHHTAVAEVLGVKFSGLFAWWLWRTIYLCKLPGIDRKLRVMIDWTLEMFLPRDINLMSPRYSQVLKEVHLDAGQTLFHQDEPAFSLYFVKSGALELHGDRDMVRLVRAGECFGERALLEDRRWHYTARAVEPTVLVSLPAATAATLAPIVQGAGRVSEPALISR
jgi:NADH dehydrogenase